MQRNKGRDKMENEIANILEEKASEMSKEASKFYRTRISGSVSQGMFCFESANRKKLTFFEYDLAKCGFSGFNFHINQTNGKTVCCCSVKK
jgi:hypothetical protein